MPTRNLGLLMPVDFDLHVDLLVGEGPLSVTAETAGGVPVPVLAAAVTGVFPDEPPGDAERAPRIFGDSFLLDNIRHFGGDAEAVAIDHGRALVCFKLQAFGDSRWWREDAPDQPSADRALSMLGPRIADAARRGDATIVLDASNEGQSFADVTFWFELLHDALRARGVPLSACVFITQNRALPFEYARLWPGAGRGDALRIETYDYYVRRFAGLTAGVATDARTAQDVRRHFAGLARLRDKAFLCMNFTPRGHRIATLSHVFQQGYDGSALISFAGFDMIKMKAADQPGPAGWARLDRLADGLARLRAKGRMTLDLPPDTDTEVPEFTTGGAGIYDATYFSLVTESDVAPADLRRITEKVLKPLSLFHPTLIVGNKGSLAILRELGFRTFSPWIDERYDLVDDPEERFWMVMDELDRLMRMDRRALADWYAGMSAVLVHNYVLANRLLDSWYRMTVEPCLVEALTRAGT